MTHRSIPVFYVPQMVAPNTSVSPSASKPAAVVASWKELGVPLDVRAPRPVSVDELCSAHDRDFVEDVLACRIPDGFGSKHPEVAASLRYTSGSMLSAARHTLMERAPVAAAPCSGFHHAGYRSAGAFCTFNGLMVTAVALRATGLATRVGILDCDMHYGDGTDDIISTLGAGDWVNHWTAGRLFWARAHAPHFFRALTDALESMRGCDVVLYQAGADPHVDDPLGGMLTTEELAERDQRVFETLAALKVPIVWNLAGGYQRDERGGISGVLEIHDNTMRACARTYGSPP